MKSVVVAMEWIPDVKAVRTAEVEVSTGGEGGTRVIVRVKASN
jgi:hypothetical protein